MRSVKQKLMDILESKSLLSPKIVPTEINKITFINLTDGIYAHYLNKDLSDLVLLWKQEISSKQDKKKT